MTEQIQTLEAEFSPTVQRQRLLNFYEAIAEVLRGNKVHKLDWLDTENYIYLFGDFLRLHKFDGDHQWILSREDLEGKDYIVLGGENK